MSTEHIGEVNDDDDEVPFLDEAAENRRAIRSMVESIRDEPW